MECQGKKSHWCKKIVSKEKVCYIDSLEVCENCFEFIKRENKKR